MIDLSPTDPKRFFAGKLLAGLTDCVTAIRADYRGWLSNAERLSQPRGIRIALASRFFNNLSDFGITSVAPAHFAEISGTNLTDVAWDNCLPSRALRPEGPGPSALIASNSRMWLKSGRTLAQASLSPYFRGLHMLSRREVDLTEASTDEGKVFLPLRRFRPDCLLANDGESVFGKLLESCSLIVIQDADLRPQDLLAHRDQTELRNTAAIDMTSDLGLKGHFSYVILRSDDPALKSLPGERLW